MFKPFMQSVRVLPQSMRQLVSEHDNVQSTYSSSHWPSHLKPISSSLKIHKLRAIIRNSNHLHICRIAENTEEMTVTYTHGQVFGRTKSRKFAQVEVKSKINILFLIIMIEKKSRRSNIKEKRAFAKILKRSSIYKITKLNAECAQ